MGAVRTSPEGPPMSDRAQPDVQGLRTLLDRLDSDLHCAAGKYYRLIGILTIFIENRATIDIDSDELARKALDIVATKLVQGEDIQNVQAYSFGIARNLVSAQTKKSISDRSDHSFVCGIRDDRQANFEAIAKEVEEDCRRKCLELLPTERRDLIVRYYQTALQSKQYREDLARELSIGVDALFNRISRIKNKLNECYRRCVRAGRDNAIPW
jgi:DNA-directed RNA polymerase specialized sigma24 family protein